MNRARIHNRLADPQRMSTRQALAVAGFISQTRYACRSFVLDDAPKGAVYVSVPGIAKRVRVSSAGITRDAT